MLQPYTIKSGTTAGAAGSAAATSSDNGPDGNKHVTGALHAIYLDFIGTHPATTDVIVRTKGRHGGAQTILSLTNVNADGWYYPRVETIDSSGSPAFYDNYMLDDDVEVVLAQDDPDVSLTCILMVVN